MYLLWWWWCVCVVCVCAHKHVHMWKSVDNFGGWFSPRMASKDQPTRLRVKHLYKLNLLTSPTCSIKNVIFFLYPVSILLLLAAIKIFGLPVLFIFLSDTLNCRVLF